MKKLSFLIVLIVLLISTGVVAQTYEEPVEQKQWYSVGEIGELPSVFSARMISGIGADDLKRYARLIGTIGEDDGGGNKSMTCWAASTDAWAGYNANYHNCLTLVGIAGAVGGVSINTIDGSDVPGDGSENGMKVFGLTYGYNGTDYIPVWADVVDASVIPDDGTQNAMESFALLYAHDGSDFSPANLITTQADGQLLTLNGIVTSSMGYIYNGATFDLMRATASGGLQVGVEAWPNSFDAGNGWQKIKKEETGVDAPVKTAGTAVDDSAGGINGDVVLASLYTLDNPNWCVTIKNAAGGSGDILAGAWVYVSPSGSAGEWESLTWTACDTLDDGDGTCSFCCSNCAYAYVMVEALCGSGDDTTVDAWYTANEN